MLSERESETMELAAEPYNADDSYWRHVLALRLNLGEASVAAAHTAMLHCGARGYLKSHRVQRRLREAYFVAIVTPATKQLRKMLAEGGVLERISNRPQLATTQKQRPAITN